MKIALLCDSILIKKSLENYLDGYIVKKEYAELIISDRVIPTNKPLMIVGHTKKSDLLIPFSKAELFWALEEFYINLLEVESGVTSKDQIEPILKKLNKKHHNKIAKLAQRIL